jgi:hypothetical protein
LELLPWLVLFGRCCGTWAEQLQQGGVGRGPQGTESLYMQFLKFSSILDVFTQRVCPLKGAMLLLLCAIEVSVDPSSGESPSGSSVAVSCLEGCKAWLPQPSTSAQLAAAGYDVEQLSSKLDAAWQAASAV